MSRRPTSARIGTIEEELRALVDHIALYRRTLNAEGVWLFLATLGCWSVTLAPMQIVALGVAVALFGQRISQRTNETRPFSRIIKDLEVRIDELASTELERKAGLYDLLNIQERELSRFTPFHQVRQFLICWVFWGGSFLYSLNSNATFLKALKSAA